jgi:hypothetical protein
MSGAPAPEVPMTRRLRVVSALCLPMVVLALSSPVRAQAPAGQTGTQFYVEYQKAFSAAKKIEDLLPYMSAGTKKQVEATPPKDRAEMFGMIKMMNTYTGVKVVKETKTATGATLTVEALDSDKKKATGEITLVREGNAWKLDKESWTS